MGIRTGLVVRGSPQLSECFRVFVHQELTACPLVHSGGQELPYCPMALFQVLPDRLPDQFPYGGDVTSALGAEQGVSYAGAEVEGEVGGGGVPGFEESAEGDFGEVAVLGVVDHGAPYEGHDREGQRDGSKVSGELLGGG